MSLLGITPPLVGDETLMRRVQTFSKNLRADGGLCYCQQARRRGQVFAAHLELAWELLCCLPMSLRGAALQRIGIPTKERHANNAGALMPSLKPVG